MLLLRRFLDDTRCGSSRLFGWRNAKTCSALFSCYSPCLHMGNTPRRQTMPRYLLAISLFALWFMAKPMVVTVPFILLLLDYWPLGRLQLSSGLSGYTKPAKAIGKVLLEKAPFFCLSVASCVVTLVAQRAGGALRTSDEVPFTLRFSNVVSGYAQYLGRIFWAISLCVPFVAG